MNIKQLLRKIKAKLYGVSNYKEVLDQSGNVLMYSGSVKAPQLIKYVEKIFTYRGNKSMVVEVLNSLTQRKLITSYEQFGNEIEGSISIIMPKDNEKTVTSLLLSHLNH